MQPCPAVYARCTVAVLILILGVQARFVHGAASDRHAGINSSTQQRAQGTSAVQQHRQHAAHSAAHSRRLQQQALAAAPYQEAVPLAAGNPAAAAAAPSAQDAAAAVAAALEAPGVSSQGTSSPASNSPSTLQGAASQAEQQQQQQQLAAEQQAADDEQQQQQQQRGRALQQQRQHRRPGMEPQRLQQQQTASSVLEDDFNTPPNDNSQLLPPPPTPPTVPSPPVPPLSPTPSDGGSSDGSGSGRDGSSNTTQPQQPDQGSLGQPWLNPAVPLSERISSLLGALTLEEKVPMMIHGQAAVPRLGLKPFQFWTECLHGHQERYDGALPTIFPQPLMLAATFDPAMAYEVFSAISDELRAKSNVELANTGIHKFLTCWTPHINIFKDPRWGRGSETFGEDPSLTAAFAQNIVRGLQGNNPSFTKVIATCKHFLGYGLEGAEGVSRYSHDLELSPQDLMDTDLPPFEACVQAASGKGIMCSYNAVNGEPACASATLLQVMLRQGLGFDGYVVSDCNAVAALTWGHKNAGSLSQAAAASLRAGVDLFCDKPDLVANAVAAGAVTEADLDKALRKTLEMRFITGQFDPPSANPWASLPISTVNSEAHRQLARKVVHRGVVLLKNDVVEGTATPLLPLDKDTLSKVCITGPLADSTEHMMGNYYGKWDDSAALTPRKAIKDELTAAGVNVTYTRGMDIIGEIHYDWTLESTLEACAGADVGLVFVGSSMIELSRTPEGAFRPATEGEGLDRLSLDLPGRQGDLVKALAKRALGLPLVVVLMHGGGLDVGWMQELPAVRSMLSVPFPGQEGGRGIADLLFGNVSPSGRLPITWYKGSYAAAVSPLDLSMRPQPSTGNPGRTFRFLQDSSHVLYPFGYGLSYTTFSYSGLKMLSPGSTGCPNPGEDPAMCIVVTVTNTAATAYRKAAEHAVPLYLTHTTLAGVNGNPKRSLAGVARTAPLLPGESQQLTFSLSRRHFMLARASDGALILSPGTWKVSLGTWDAPLLSDLAPSGTGASGAGQQQQQQQQRPNTAAAGVGAGAAAGLQLGAGDIVQEGAFAGPATAGGTMAAEPSQAAAGVQLPGAAARSIVYTGKPVALPQAGAEAGEATAAGVSTVAPAVQQLQGARRQLKVGGPSHLPQGAVSAVELVSSGSSGRHSHRVLGSSNAGSSSTGSSEEELTWQQQELVFADSQMGLAIPVHVHAESQTV